MTASNTDEGILSNINRLVSEERQLWNSPDLDDRGRAKLEKIKVELDQCWDLLRQRDALREFGNDPDRAQVRSAAVVEKYEG